jgi:hypothetical protein
MGDDGWTLDITEADIDAARVAFIQSVLACEPIDRIVELHRGYTSLVRALTVQLGERL